MLRRVTRRNYGIVNLVNDGKKIVSKIKSFDYGLIWKDKECWVLASSRIKQLSNDGNKINDDKQIDTDAYATLVDTVPVIFLDVHSFQPLTLTGEGRDDVYPEEIGSCLKGWADNQRAKLLSTKKMEDVMTLIIIGAVAFACILCFSTMGEVESLTEDVHDLKLKLNLMHDLLIQMHNSTGLP